MAMLIALCALAAVAGGLIGYFLNQRGAHWRRRFVDERAYYADYRARAESLLAARGTPAAIAPPPLIVDHTAPVAPMPMSPPPKPIAAHPLDLTRIKGIDAALAGRLGDLGVVSYEDLATLTAEDEMALELRLGLNAGTIARDQWQMQARVLSDAEPTLADQLRG